jgi:hypothetical protein
MSPEATAWLVRLTEAVAAADPEQGWAQALACLAEVGVTTAAPRGQGADEPAWLTLDDGTRLYCEAEPPSSALEPAINAVLSGLRLRWQAQERMQMLSNAGFEGLFIHIDGEIIDANAGRRARVKMPSWPAGRAR